MGLALQAAIGCAVVLNDQANWLVALADLLTRTSHVIQEVMYLFKRTYDKCGSTPTPARNQMLGNLNRIERGTLTQVVRDNPEV